MTRIQYSSPEERETILAQQEALGKYLIEDLTTLDGSYLVYEDDEALNAFHAAERADALIQKLRKASPVEINTWIDGNINNLGDARVMFKKLALLVSILMKRAAL